MKHALCHIFKNRPATIHLVAVDDDGSVAEIHLSQAAVRRLGLNLQDHPPTPQHIRWLLEQADQMSEEDLNQPTPSLSLQAPTLLVSERKNATTPDCQQCGLSYDEFLETNRFGCGECYNAFAGRLDRALKDLHGHNRHTGRAPSDQYQPTIRLKLEREQLQRQLAAAVADEAYEVAAQLRDRLNDLQATLNRSASTISTASAPGPEGQA